MKVVVAAGGTGGHLYPALALVEYIKKQDPNSKFLFIGTKDRLESQVVPQLGYDYVGLNVKGLAGNPLKKAHAALLFVKSIGKAKKVIKKFNPDIVVGFGGYPSASALEAAASLKIKTMIHEQNSIIGLTNKILIKKVDKIICCYQKAYEEFPQEKTLLLGNPRASVVSHEVPKDIYDKYGLDRNKKVVTIVMGSLGSQTVNQTMKESMNQFVGKEYQVLYVTGKPYYESMKDYEKELEESMKTIEEGDILTGTVISVDEKEVILDLKYYAEGVIPAENYSREPGFSLKDEVHEGDEVSATVVRKDDGQGNILLSRVEAVDVLAWDKLKELKESGEVLDVVVKGITNAGVIAYVEGVRGFIPASKLALNYVEDTEEYLNKPIQVQVLDVDKESKKLILSAKEILRAKAEEERKNKVSNLEIGLVTEGTVESLQPYGAFVNLGNGLSGLVHISQICEKRIKKPSEVLAVGDTVKVKVTAIKDGKLSLSIKEATDMMAKEIEEEVYEVPDAGEQATTSLGSLFANIKLD